MGGACITHERVENACKVLAVRSEGKRPLGRNRRRWDADMSCLV
jgi:hypothetical protein